MNPNMRHGWHQVAYERNLKEGLNAVDIGGTAIALVARSGAVVAIDAVCPHRGAHLCHGGRLGDDHIVCPFHGFKIGLGKNVGGFQAAPYDCFLTGGLVFVKRLGGPESAFRTRLEALDANHFIVPGFEMEVEAPASLVVENAFDATHFHPVHKLLNHPTLEGVQAGNGSYVVEGIFRVPPSQWQTRAQANGSDVPFRATAYSPTLVLSELGGEKPYCMLTSTHPVDERHCIVRLSLLIPLSANEGPPREADCHYLLKQAKAGIEQDALIWKHMKWPPVFSPVESDKTIMGFQKFCEMFNDIAPERA